MALADTQGELYLQVVKFELNIEQTAARTSRCLLSVAYHGLLHRWTKYYSVRNSINGLLVSCLRWSSVYVCISKQIHPTMTCKSGRVACVRPRCVSEANVEREDGCGLKFLRYCEGYHEGKRRRPGKTTVLNLASDLFLGGGWTHSLSKTGVDARLTIAAMTSSTLFIHPVRDFERVVLPTAEPRPRFSPWDLFSRGCHLQRRIMWIFQRQRDGSSRSSLLLPPGGQNLKKMSWGLRMNPNWKT